MKYRFFIALLFAAAPLAIAHEGDHGKAKAEATAHHQHEATPNGGRLIHRVDPHAEFLLTAERKVEIRFIKDGAVIAPAGQIVTLVGGDRAKPTRLTFALEGDRLVSSGALPEGDNLPVILQIRSSPDAKPVIERFTLNLAKCPECELAEYACACEHDHGGGPHGHKH